MKEYNCCIVSSCFQTRPSCGWWQPRPRRPLLNATTWSPSEMPAPTRPHRNLPPFPSATTILHRSHSSSNNNSRNPPWKPPGSPATTTPSSTASSRPAKIIPSSSRFRSSNRNTFKARQATTNLACRHRFWMVPSSCSPRSPCHHRTMWRICKCSWTGAAAVGTWCRWGVTRAVWWATRKWTGRRPWIRTMRYCINCGRISWNRRRHEIFDRYGQSLKAHRLIWLNDWLVGRLLDWLKNWLIDWSRTDTVGEETVTSAPPLLAMSVINSRSTCVVAQNYRSIFLALPKIANLETITIFFTVMKISFFSPNIKIAQFLKNDGFLDNFLVNKTLVVRLWLCPCNIVVRWMDDWWIDWWMIDWWMEELPDHIWFWLGFFLHFKLPLDAVYFFLLPESMVKCRWWALVHWKPRRPVKKGIHADLCCHFPNAPALHITVTSLSASSFCADEITDIFYSFQKKKKILLCFSRSLGRWSDSVRTSSFFYIAAYTIAYNSHAPSAVVLDDGRCFFSPSSSLTEQYRKCTVFVPDPFYSGCDLFAALLLLLLTNCFLPWNATGPYCVVGITGFAVICILSESFLLLLLSF